MKTLRFGIIGLGVGAQHIPGFLAHPKAELAAVCDFSQDKLDEVGKHYPQAKATKDADQILTDPTIQVVSIASYDQFHKEQVIKALENGKHVFVEKPLCQSETELAAIYVAHRKNPALKLSSNLILRRYPRFVELKQRIVSGVMGSLYNLEADYNYGRLEKLHEGWRGEGSYSVVLGGGIHMVDLMQWLKGERIVEVFAFGNRICSEGSKFQGLDMVQAACRFSGGAVGKMAANFGCVFPHMHRLAIYGTKASFVNDVSGAQYFHTRQEGVSPELSAQPYPAAKKGDLLYDFLEAIVTGGQGAVASEDVFSGAAVCLAIERSLRENKPVTVQQF